VPEEELWLVADCCDLHKGRKPGKITLMRGLRRLVEMWAIQAVLSRYAAEHQ
jgi:hypothetical protein